MLLNQHLLSLFSYGTSDKLGYVNSNLFNICYICFNNFKKLAFANYNHWKEIYV